MKFISLTILSLPLLVTALPAGARIPDALNPTSHSADNGLPPNRADPGVSDDSLPGPTCNKLSSKGLLCQEERDTSNAEFKETANNIADVGPVQKNGLGGFSDNFWTLYCAAYYPLNPIFCIRAAKEQQQRLNEKADHKGSKATIKSSSTDLHTSDQDDKGKENFKTILNMPATTAYEKMPPVPLGSPVSSLPLNFPPFDPDWGLPIPTPSGLPIPGPDNLAVPIPSNVPVPLPHDQSITAPQSGDLVQREVSIQEESSPTLEGEDVVAKRTECNWADRMLDSLRCLFSDSACGKCREPTSKPEPVL